MTHQPFTPDIRLGLTAPSEDLINLLALHSFHPVKFGRSLKRRVVEYSPIGRSNYYWNETAEKRSREVPHILIDYLVENDIPFDPLHTSILVNYYVENSTIGKHTDTIKNLKPGSKVHSISFASSELLHPHREFPVQTRIGRISFSHDIGRFDIMNRSVMSWCPFEHHEHKIKHWTHATRFGNNACRVNITVRQLK